MARSMPIKPACSARYFVPTRPVRRDRSQDPNGSDDIKLDGFRVSGRISGEAQR